MDNRPINRDYNEPRRATSPNFTRNVTYSNQRKETRPEFSRFTEPTWTRSSPRTNPSSRKTTSQSCALCADEGKTTSHSLRDCEYFEQMSMKDKRRLVEDQRRCFQCLERHYPDRNCARANMAPCSTCRRKHADEIGCPDVPISGTSLFSYPDESDNRDICQYDEDDPYLGDSELVNNSYRPVVPQPGRSAIRKQTPYTNRRVTWYDQESAQQSPPPSLERNETWTIEGTIPEVSAGAVIGWKGEKIRQLRLQSGAQIRLEDRRDEPFIRGFSVRGSKEAICMAMNLISHYDTREHRRYFDAQGEETSVDTFLHDVDPEPERVNSSNWSPMERGTTYPNQAMRGSRSPREAVEDVHR